MANNQKKAAQKEHSPTQRDTLPPHSGSANPVKKGTAPDYSSMHNEVEQIGKKSSLEGLKDFYNID